MTAGIGGLQASTTKIHKTERLGHTVVLLCASMLLVATLAVVGFVGCKGAATFMSGAANPLEFISGTAWMPDAPPEEGGPRLGALPFIAGSVMVTALAVLVSTPLSIGSAVFISEISPTIGERVLKPVTELFVGIPSVVYGWIGLSVLVPFVRNHIGGLGFSVLSGGLVLSIMILPTIASVSLEAIKAVPDNLREAAYSLGCTRWQVIRRVVLPSASLGILTGIVLGMARAFGEALAVQMVIGNVRKVPDSLLSPGITVTSGITMDMGNTIMGSSWNNALWSLALLLLLVSLGFILLVKVSGKMGRLRGGLR